MGWRKRFDFQGMKEICDDDGREIFFAKVNQRAFMKMAFGSHLAGTLAEALDWEKAPAPPSV